MKFYIGSDHAGFERKQELITSLRSQSIELVDFGTNSLDSVDFPDYADLVCRALIQDPRMGQTSFGLLICGSGQGMNIRANKYPQIRAALCWNQETGALAREHNDANLLCLGARFVSREMAENILEAFKNASFAGGRHRNRVDKINSPL